MATARGDGKRISLGTLDVRVLLALLLGAMNGYEIARQCEKDADGAYEVSNGALYKSLKCLLVYELIEQVEVTPERRPGKPAVYYVSTNKGQNLLRAKLNSWMSLALLANNRSENC